MAAALQQVLIHHHTLYSIGTDDERSANGFLVTAHRARSGEPLWSVREADPEVDIYGCRVVHTGRVLVTTSYGSPGSFIRVFEP